jgi:hypothetical protein
MYDYKGNIITPDRNFKFVHILCTSVILNCVNSTETGPNQLWSRVHVEKPIVLQLVEKFPGFYGAQRFITRSTGVSFCLQLAIILISLFILSYIHVCVSLSVLKR